MARRSQDFAGTSRGRAVSRPEGIAMPFPAIEIILEEAIGLHPSSIGSSAIDRAISQRMLQLGLVDSSKYEVLLRAGAGELQELIETVIVPETWFFRDLEAI